jgi:hypothetical protein
LQIKNFINSLGIIENSLDTALKIRKQLIKICKEKKLKISSCGNDFSFLRFIFIFKYYKNLLKKKLFIF